MEIKSLSASAFEHFSHCEWKFFLSYILKYGEDKGNPASVLGNLVHTFLEILSKLKKVKHRKDSKFFDEEYLWRICYNRYYKTHPQMMDKIKQDKLKKVCKGVKELLTTEYSPLNGETIAIEQWFDLPLKDKIFKIPDKDDYYHIRGYIDRVIKHNDEMIEIVDYKTGTRTDYNSKTRKKKEPEDLKKLIQPCLYFLAARELYPWAKTIIVTFIYIIDGGPISIPFCNEDVPKIYRMIKDRVIAIKNNNDPQRNRSFMCKYMCQYGPYESGQCSELWKEKQECGIEFMTNKYIALNYNKKKK